MAIKERMAEVENWRLIEDEVVKPIKQKLNKKSVHEATPPGFYRSSLQEARAPMHAVGSRRGRLGSSSEASAALNRLKPSLSGRTRLGFKTDLAVPGRVPFHKHIFSQLIV